MGFRVETDAEPIPGYRLISRLGGGGYGDVWKCEAPGGLNKAIKFVFGQLGPSDNAIGDDTDTGRAEQELKSLERIKMIRHPFILALDRYEITDGQLMIVSELADCSLFDRFRDCQQQGLKGIPREELLNYLLETAEALDYMTEKHDLLHLDIKPQNLFLLCNHIKIGDFGLVKDVQGKLASVTGGFTTNYAAPESFEGYVSRFSDQYSLAIVYQELLTGSRPYTGTNIKQILFQHIQGKPNLDPLPTFDRPVIERALAKSPSDRWPSSMAMVNALVSAEEGWSAYDPDTMMMAQAHGETTAELSLQEQERSAPAGLVSRANIRSALPQSVPSEPITKVRTANLEELGLSAHPEQAGVLRPVIMIGLGQMGRAVLQAMKQEVFTQFGTPDFPLLRMLAIDTEPTRPGSMLIEQPYPEDLLTMPLSRPTRYIRTRDELPPVEAWIDPEVLYRMPRTLITNGIRSLGRLAFIEHYSEFVTRFERELKAVLSPEAQAQACKLSNMTMRKTEPLIYIITHLGGGTGSGMFLDCAYVVQSILKNKQVNAEEVAGIFLAPLQQEKHVPDLPEVNAVAALHELYHYQQSGEPFRAQYKAKSDPVAHTTPPFNHCLFVETSSKVGKPQPGKLSSAGSTIRQLVQSLSRILFSPLGQVADPAWLSHSSHAVFQSLGSRVVSSSRKKIIQHASSALFNQMIDHWLKPLSSVQTPEAEEIVTNFLQKHRLGGPELMKYLEIAVATVLQKSSEQYARELLIPLSVPIKERLPKPIEIENALKEILNTLGNNKRGDSVAFSILEPVTRVSQVLSEAVDRLVQSAIASLKSTVYQLVDKPNGRLGLADETINHANTVFEQKERHHNQLAKQQQEKFATALSCLKSDLLEYERLRQTTKFLWPKLPSPGEHLAVIYQARYTAMLQQHIASIFTSLRNSCAGMIQELRHCRSKLLDVRQVRRLHDDLVQGGDVISGHGQTWLIPLGYNDLFQVVQQVINNITPSEMEGIDQRLAIKLKASSSPLVEFSHSSSESLLSLRQLVQEELSAYLDQSMPTDDMADLFAEHHQNLGQAVENMHAEINVPVGLPAQTSAFEVAFLMLPQSEGGATMELEIRQMFPDLLTLQSSTNQEIVLYRALLGIQLFELSVMNEACLKAFKTAKAIEHFTPHSRQDIERWHNPVVQTPTEQLQVQRVLATGR